MPNPFNLTGPGVDISHHNVDDRGSPINWNAVFDAGYVFAIIKASDGATTKDHKFVENVTGAREAGILVGAYHFLRAGSQSADQAQNFLDQVNAAGGPGVLDLGAAVDVEDPDDDPGAWNRISRVQRIAKVSNFLDAVEPSFPSLPLIYCIPAWWASHFGMGADFSGHPLWAASPGKSPDLSGTTWDDYALWQYSFHGNVPGISQNKSVDLDRPNY